jgi:Fic family protein
MFLSKITFDFKTNQSILAKIAQIDSFKGKWGVIEHKGNSYLKELKKLATIQSIGSSTRIEGATLSDEEIKSLIGQVSITDLEDRDQQEVMGYYDALSIILDNYQQIPLTANYIKQLHKILLTHSGKDALHRGEYKNSSNAVAMTYPDGQERVIFRPTEPFLVAKEMEELISWTRENLDSGEIHPLLVISVFVYEFLSIHPFQDGNGRLSRLLTTILLMKSGYEFVQYISFEHVIEDRKKEYYGALMDGQKDRGTQKENIGLWILFFLESMDILIHKLEAKYAIYEKTGRYLGQRQQQIVDFIKENAPVKLADLTQAFPEIAKNTIKKDLQNLKAIGQIRQLGEFRGAVYVVEEN